MLVLISTVVVISILFVLVPLRLRTSRERQWMVAERAIALAAVIWSVVVSACLAFVPFYEGVVAEGTGSGTTIMMETRTFLEVNGHVAAVYLMAPIILSALPWAARRPSTRRRLGLVGAMLLCGFVIVGALSVGLFYGPSALFMLISAALENASRCREGFR